MMVVMVEPFASFEPGQRVRMDREAAVMLIRRGIARLWTPGEDDESPGPNKSMKRRRLRRKAEP